jgi:acetoacetyl-CoA reductase
MGRVAIVTGGTRGIGKAICMALKAAGHTVAATYHGNDEAAQAFTKETGVHSFKWDVANFEACQEGVAKVAADVGPVDILVNNAGITRDATLMRMSHDDWQAVIDTNLGSCFNMSKAVFAGMRERQFGRIVNISSINGQKGQMGQVNYSAAKAGMIGFAKALAQEGARHGITVNCIAPGYTETDMVAAVPQKILDSIIAQIPVGRLGSVDDIARGVVFLCAEEAGWITGSTLTINGGHYFA